MLFGSKKIIAVGAHPDDIELGCGGTVSVASTAGSTVVAIILTKGEKGGNPEIRVEESKKALGILGVKDIYFGDFPDAEITVTHKVVDFLEKICEAHKPDLVLTHSVHETHQDHRQVGWVSLSAFRRFPRVLAYETRQATTSFRPTYFVDISQHVDSKWAAAQCHLSQKDKLFLGYDAFVNVSSFRGSQANLPAAEAFEVIRYVDIP